MLVRTVDRLIVDIGNARSPEDDDGGTPELISLRAAQVHACLHGRPLARGVAISGLTAGQFNKLFGTSAESGGGRGRYRHARRLAVIGAAIRHKTARAALANATVRELVEAARYRDPQAQIEAASAVRISSRLARLCGASA